MNKRNVGNKSPGAHSTPECILGDVDWLKYEISKYECNWTHSDVYIVG